MFQHNIKHNNNLMQNIQDEQNTNILSKDETSNSAVSSPHWSRKQKEKLVRVILFEQFWYFAHHGFF